jgi:hypothetical protein
MSGRLAGNHWLPRWDEIDDNLIQGWDSNNGNSGLNSLIHSLYQVNAHVLLSDLANHCLSAL